jgi:hypothetical protein
MAVCLFFFLDYVRELQHGSPNWNWYFCILTHPSVRPSVRNSNVKLPWHSMMQTGNFWVCLCDLKQFHCEKTEHSLSCVPPALYGVESPQRSELNAESRRDFPILFWEVSYNVLSKLELLFYLWLLQYSLLYTTNFILTTETACNKWGNACMT